MGTDQTYIANILIPPLIGVFGVILGVVLEKWLNNRSESKKKIRDAEIENARDSLQACKEILLLLYKWYDTIRKRIDPNQPYNVILGNLRILWMGDEFESKIKHQINVINHEPLCSAILGEVKVFRESAYEAKEDAVGRRGKLHEELDQDGRELYDLSRKADKTEYFNRIIDDLHRAYRHVEENLNGTIEQLDEKIYRLKNPTV
jgi:hypothetical protein